MPAKTMARTARQKDWQSITDDREKYQAYLCSREWAEKREAVRERAYGICERCCVLPMNAVHHLTYARKYDEPLDDLQAICKACHEFTHGKSAIDPVEWKSWLWYVVPYKQILDPNRDWTVLPDTRAIEELIEICERRQQFLSEMWERLGSNVGDAADALDRELEAWERVTRTLCDLLHPSYAWWIENGRPQGIPPEVFQWSKQFIGCRPNFFGGKE